MSATDGFVQLHQRLHILCVDFADLFHLYDKVWAKEEHAREQAWYQLLADHCTEHSDRVHFSDLVAIADHCLGDVWLTTFGSKAADEETLKRRRHIEELVQKGVPIRIRGAVWRLMLDDKTAKQKGYYWVRCRCMRGLALIAA